MRKLFGTDGIRGKANEYPMTSEVALAVGKAVASIIKGKSEKKCKILIGKDPRRSGYIIEYALTAGICSMGVDVLLVGPMPTAAIALLTRSFRADAGIVISASHNHADDNGIKIFSSSGEKLPDSDEEQIEKLVLENNMKCSHIAGNLVGKAFRIDDAHGRYIEYVKQTINGDIKGLKIVIDCAHGAAYKLGPIIFDELGADVLAINNKPDGLNINLDCGATKPEGMAKTVVDEKADCGFALDGDADRVIFSDEKGNIVDGDFILAILAVEMKRKKILKKDTVVSTVMANLGFREAMKKNNISVVSSQVGDRYVYEMMKKEGYNLGGEQSGHIICSDLNTTGDGIITALAVLETMKRTGKKLSLLCSIMKKYPQVLLNVKVREKKDIEALHAYTLIKKYEKQLGDNGRILVRYSGTEKICRVMIEGGDELTIAKIAKEISDAIKKEIGE